MAQDRKRFAHRWIVVTETQHVVLKPTFRYRSFARKSDALALIDRPVQVPFVRRYLVDRDNSPHVILPQAA